MAFGLTIGTERATALQNAVQDELTKRGYSIDADPVMAEYITIMVINNKTAEQISSELEDLIGSDFDSSFVDWLFAEVAKGAPEAAEQPIAVPEPAPTPVAQTRTRDEPPHLPPNDSSTRPSNGPRTSAPLYRQAIAQAMPGTSPSGQKRNRSPSPSGHVNKSRRVDLPTGPRAMQQRDGGGPSNQRSLLDRMGPSRNGRAHDEIQARIDSITGPSPQEMMMMQQNGGFPPMNGMPGMDMAAMQGMGGNPMMLQDMMMSQMAMMAQMANAMGLLNPAMNMNGQFPGGPGMNGDMSGMPNGMNGPPQHGPDGRGRGRGRGGPRGGGGRGRGAHHSGPGHPPTDPSSNPAQVSSSAPPEPAVAPTTAAAPIVHSPAPQLASSLSQSRTSVAIPERPQSPTLCKFSLKCTNPSCKYSHPSPVATPESGVVLSNEACEAGKDCKDKDCVKAHVSPAVLKPNAEHLNPKAPAFTPAAAHHAPAQSQVPCRFGAACTRPGCTFLHPARQNTTPCRFGAACTKATCPFQHPEGRGVLPSTFHRGLGANGSDSTASHNKSVTFNNSSKPATAAELEKKLKEMEEKKSQAQAAVKQAQAAAAAGKDGSTKSVSVAV